MVQRYLHIHVSCSSMSIKFLCGSCDWALKKNYTQICAKIVIHFDSPSSHPILSFNPWTRKNLGIEQRFQVVVVILILILIIAMIIPPYSHKTTLSTVENHFFWEGQLWISPASPALLQTHPPSDRTTYLRAGPPAPGRR